jgi:shikimate kinase
MLKGVNLYLVGMMGAGKSTVGRLLATELHYRFLDLDQLIEQVSGRSVSALFAEQGEAAFRALESRVLAEAATYTRTVVATGGGVVLDRGNWGYLHGGIVVWLDAPVAVLAGRLATGEVEKRPLLATTDLSDRLSALLEQRRALYAQADVRIEAAGAPAEVAAQVLAGVRARLAEDVD